MTAREPRGRSAGRARRTGRVWRATGTLALAFGLVPAGVQTWAMVGQQQTVSDRAYPVAVTRVQLDTGIAGVRIRPGRDGQVLVRQHLDWTARKPAVETTLQGDVLTVRVRCRLVLPIVEVGCGALIELEVPAAASVVGEGSSGSIEVKGLSGEVRLFSGSGSVALAGLSGTVYARTTSGQVRAAGLGSARVEVDTASGAVDLDFAKPPHAVAVGARSGSVALTLPHGSRYAFSGDAGSGDRHIDPMLADSSSPDTVRVVTTSGSVKVDAAAG